MGRMRVRVRQLFIREVYRSFTDTTDTVVMVDLFSVVFFSFPPPLINHFYQSGLIPLVSLFSLHFPRFPSISSFSSFSSIFLMTSLVIFLFFYPHSCSFVLSFFKFSIVFSPLAPLIFFFSLCLVLCYT